jgi:hypothetical protein
LPRRETAADSQDVSWLTVAGKRVLIGRSFPTYRATEQLPPERIALPVFASDPLSSVAYATRGDPAGEGVPCPTSFSCC